MALLDPAVETFFPLGSKLLSNKYRGKQYFNLSACWIQKLPLFTRNCQVVMAARRHLLFFGMILLKI